LEGLLHVFRRYEHCRDVIVFVSQETPQSYLKYLADRSYDFIVSGVVKVDFEKAIGELQKTHPFSTMITDNGGTLSAVLFDQSLIDQISLLISPVLTDWKNPKLFRELKLGKRIVTLEPAKAEILPNKDILLVFNVIK